MSKKYLEDKISDSTSHKKREGSKNTIQIQKHRN